MDGTEIEIVAKRDVGSDTIALDLEAPPSFDARPGQFVQVRGRVDGETVTRHYSISSPRAADVFEITVGIDPEGTLSPWLADAAPGDTVAIDGPYGRVYYEDESRIVVLASGPGIGPAVGVVGRALEEGGEAVVVYRTDAPVHESRLARLAAAGATVYVTGTDAGFEAALESTVDFGQVFAYGFAPFIEAAEAAIAEAGGDPANAKTENFG